jgi:hypothetical protein
MGKCGLALSGSGQRLVADSCENDDEPSGSVQCWEFLE